MFFSVHRGVFACASVFEFVCRQYPLWIYWSLRCVVVRYEKPHWSNVPMGLSWFCPFVFSAFWAKNGARTRDPDLGKVVLYQLSYFRIKSERKTGLEPATLTLARLCSTNWAIFAFTILIKNSSVGYSQLRCKSNTFFLKAKKIREIFPGSKRKSLKRPSPLVFCHIFRNFDTLN